MKTTDSLIQKKYILRIDNNGFIEPSKIYEKPDLSIVFLGDSSTECFLVDENNRFPFLVGRFIENSSGLKVNSYNSGVSYNNSLHSINILFNKIMPLNPQVAVMMHVTNDLNTLLFEKSYWGRASAITKKFSFRDDVRNAMKHRMIKQEAIVEKSYLLKEYKTNIKLFIRFCRERNIVPVLMTEANRLKENPDAVISRQIERMLGSKSGISYSLYKELYDSFNQEVREIGVNEKVMVIDLDKAIPKEKEYMYDVIHYNDNGSKFVSKFISKSLEPLINKLIKQGE